MVVTWNQSTVTMRATNEKNESAFLYTRGYVKRAAVLFPYQVKSFPKDEGFLLLYNQSDASEMRPGVEKGSMRGKRCPTTASQRYSNHYGVHNSWTREDHPSHDTRYMRIS